MRPWAFLVLIALYCSAAVGQTIQSDLIGAAITKSPGLEKAVPRTDKATAELIGTVDEVQLIVSCGQPVAFVWLTVNGIYPFLTPAAVGCAGSLFNTCAGLRPGTRVRVQAKVVPLPDPSTPGFDACDPGTWLWQIITPAYAVAATKILK
jgi:hypothetical protein